MMSERLGYKNIFEAITDDPVEALELKIDSDRVLIQRLQKERDELKAKNMKLSQLISGNQNAKDMLDALHAGKKEPRYHLNPGFPVQAEPAMPSTDEILEWCGQKIIKVDSVYLPNLIKRALKKWGNCGG